jgi:surfactin family lipopeptide synthetase A
LPGEALTSLIQKQAITVLSMPPSALRPLDPHQLSWIKMVVVAGEACPLELAQRWAGQCRFINAYGPTEYTVYASAGDYRPTDPLVALGAPLANTQLFLLDQQMRLVPPGVAGELYLAGASLARGYLHRPDLTAERFVPHPYSQEPGARLYRTGDRVRTLPDGRLEFLGRVDQQIKLRGFRIELGEIEHALREQENVQEAVVIMREDQPGQPRLVAYLVAQTDQTVALPSIRQALKQRLPEYMLPSAYLLLPALPLLANGKLNRRALPEPDQERPVLENPFVAPRSKVEAGLVEVWSDVLGLVQVGIYDNFFDLGGHSLLIPQVHSKIKERGIGNPTLVDLFHYPTIKLLAEHIQKPAGQEKMQALARPHQERAQIRQEILRRQSDLRRRR